MNKNIKGKLKKFAIVVLTLLLSGALTVGMVLCGYIFTPENMQLWSAVSLSLVGVWLAWMIVNVVFTLRLEKKYNGMSTRQFHDYGMGLLKDIQSDYARAEREVNKSLTVAYVAVSIACVLYLLIAFAVGATRSMAFITPVASIVLGAVYCCLSIFAPINAQTVPEKKNFLRDGDFPALYKTARAAAEMVGCKKPVFLTAESDGIGVEESGGKIIISLDAAECAILSQEEFFTVILHECAHVKNSDTARTRRFNRGMSQMIDSQAFIGASLLCSLFFTKFGIHNTFYRFMASRHHEMLADEVVKSSGNAQHFINATAKGEMYMLYIQTPRRELTFDLLESQTVPEDITERKIKGFYSCLEREGQMWKNILSRQIPARVDSHPTLKQRMEAMGIDSYDIADRAEGDYAADCDKLARFWDDIFRRNIADNYAEIRESNYVECKQIMDNYENSLADGKELSLNELTRCMDAFYGVDSEKTLEIANSILAKTSNYGYALYCRAKVFADRLDDRCIADFRAAMAARSELARECLNELGLYALKTGNQALLDDYRANGPDQDDEAQNNIKAHTWKKGVPLRPTALDGAEVDDIRDFIFERGGNFLRRAYIADFGDGDTVVVVRLRYNTPPKAYNKILNDIGHCLDNRNKPIVLYYNDNAIMHAIRKAKITPLKKGGD